MLATKLDRKNFIGGSDARVIMGKDEKALLRLWREKRGEEAPQDLSSVLIVQLGLVTEDLNRRWYELNSGHRISDIQRHAIHRTMPWMAATLDGLQPVVKRFWSLITTAVLRKLVTLMLADAYLLDAFRKACVTPPISVGRG